MTSMDIDSPTTPIMAITPVMSTDNDETPISVEQPNKRRRKKSIVWEHFTIETVGAGHMRACCKQCKKSFAYITGSKLAGTSHLKRHIALGICPVSRQKNESAQFIPGAKSDPPPKRRYRASPGLGSIPFDQDRCNQDAAKMIIQHEYRLQIMEQPGFVDFMRALQPQYNTVSFDTIQGECVALYLREKQGLLDLISGLPGRVNLTLDLRTSNYDIGYAFITGHFIDADWNLHRRILNVVMLPFPDSEYAFNQAVASCISDWHLEGRLFTLTLDQSFSNDNVIGNLRGLLSVKNSLLFHGQLVKGNCYARVLSRLAQDALGATGEVVKRVRESVKYVKTSETHDEKFAELRQRLQVPSTRDLIIDDRTKWDTTYQMLVAACELKEVFACLDSTDPVYRINPSMDDWKQVEILCTYLKLLYDAASILTGPTYPPANAFYHEVSKIQLELTHAAMSQDPFVSNLARPLKEKFDQYWRDCFLVLAIAIVMDPRFKMKLVEFSFSRIFGEDAGMWIKIVDDGIHDLFLDYISLSHSVPTTFMGAGNVSIHQSDVFQGVPQEIVSQEASFQAFQVVHPADVSHQEVDAQGATLQELQPEEVAHQVQTKEETVQDASPQVMNHQEIVQQEMHPQEVPVQEMQTQELPLQEMDNHELPAKAIDTQEPVQEMDTEKEPAQEMVTQDVSMQEINTTEVPAQEMHTQEGPVKKDNQEVSLQEMQVEESVPAEGIQAQPTQDVQAQEKPTQEVQAPGKPAEEMQAEEQSAQEMHAEEQLTQVMDAEEQPFQEMHAEEKLNQEVDIGGKLSQEVDVQEKKTPEMHASEKPTEEMRAMEKPTEDMHGLEKLAEEMHGLEKPDEEMHGLENPAEEIPGVEKPADEMHATEKPAEEMHALEKPAEEMHASEKPAEDMHASEKPAEEMHAAEKPAEEMHAAEKPAEEMHAAEKPAEEMPPQEVQNQEVPPQEVQKMQATEKPAEEMHAAEKPAEEMHAAEKPAEEMPPLEVQNQEVPPQEAQNQLVPPQEVQTQEVLLQEVQTQEMPPQEVQTQVMPPQDVQCQEMHHQEVSTQELHPEATENQGISPPEAETEEIHPPEMVHEMQISEKEAQEMLPLEGETHVMHSQGAQIHRMHSQEAQIHSMHSQEAQIHSIHSQEAQTHGMHSQEAEMHPQEAQTQEMNSQEASSHGMQPQEVQSQDLHFEQVQYHDLHQQEVQGLQAQEMDYQSLSHEMQSHGIHTQDLPLLSIGDGLQDFEVYISEIASSQHLKSELDQYLEESLLPRVQEFDVLGWWRLNKLKYPTLSKMAADILSIPVSTVAPESVFDTVSKKIDKNRSSLRPVTLEALVCAKDWLQYGSSSSSLDVSNALVKMEY